MLLFTAGCSGDAAASTVVLDENGNWQARMALAWHERLFADGISGAWPFSSTGSLDDAITFQESARPIVLSSSGDGGLAEVRRLIYGRMRADGLPFQPGSRLTLVGQVQKGESLTVTLEAAPAAGYTWNVSASTTAVQPAGSPRLLNSRSGEGAEGASQDQVFSFSAAASGEARLEFVYRRPWEAPASLAPALVINAPDLADLADLTNPYELPAPLEIPAPAGAYVSEPQPLPSRWDWREQAALPPVRDQGSCGSCWAFATVGALETNIAIRDGIQEDLSEQYLVSCNSYGWSCASGGGTAHGYHYDLFRTPDEFVPGAVLEQDFPYTARDDTCSGPHPHSYRLNGWDRVSKDNYYTVDEEAIKQAIYRYGPVKVSICAGVNFANYRSGVFTVGDSCSPGFVNHAVVLTGWDDTLEHGVWYLRNSWGPDWGEGGYMTIARGISYVGAGASYVDYGSFEENIFIPMVIR